MPPRVAMPSTRQPQSVRRRVKRNDHRHDDRAAEARAAGQDDADLGARYRLDQDLLRDRAPRPEGKALKGRTHTAEVIGFGYGASSGIKSGVITDLDQAEQAIRTVVGMAERAAGLTVQSVVVNVTAGRLGSETFSATVNLGAQEVEVADIQRVLRAVNQRSVRPERSIVHALPIGYAIDGQKGVRDPRGLVGEKLSVDVAVISAETLAMRNIELVLNRCHLQIEALMATPYASGL